MVLDLLLVLVFGLILGLVLGSLLTCTIILWLRGQAEAKNKKEEVGSKTSTKGLIELREVWVTPQGTLHRGAGAWQTQTKQTERNCAVGVFHHHEPIAIFLRDAVNSLMRVACTRRDFGMPSRHRRELRRSSRPRMYHAFYQRSGPL